MADQELVNKIVAMVASEMTDGFNRSLGALRKAKAIDTTRMSEHCCGVGSKYYDMVTEQMNITAEYARPIIEEMVEGFEARLVEKGWSRPDDKSES